MKSLLFVPLLTLFTVCLSGQEISHQVLLPAAGVMTAGEISYQQTVGETAVEIFVNSPNTLTQGFQQPTVIVDPVDPHVHVSGIAVYPNPVYEGNGNTLTVQLISSKTRSYSVVIFNFSGSVVYSWNSDLIMDEGYEKTVPMDDFSRGIYIVRVISADKEIDLSFKIEKL